MGSIEQYGKFIEGGDCFELTAEPPRKWENLHYNQYGGADIYCMASNIGDGVTTIRDFDGTTYELIDYDSKYLYVRNENTGTVFCPGGAPVPTPVEDASVRYYREKTVISGTCEGVKVSQTIFVPRDFLNEIWSVQVENATDQPQTISLFAYAVFKLTGKTANGDPVGAGNSSGNFSEVLPELNGVLVTNRNQRAPTDRFKAYIATLDNYVGGCGYRDFFLRQDYSSAAPRILHGWNCDNRSACGPDCAGIVQVKLEIPAGETRRADFVIGQASDAEDAKKQMAQFTPAVIDEQLEIQKQTFAQKADGFKIDTGYKNIDALMNGFVKKQLEGYLIMWSGFRDNVQDINGLALADYSVARQNMLHALASQYANGIIPHAFRPISRKPYADQPCWAMQTVADLIKESNDFALLDEVVPYFESDEEGTVWDHLIRGMRHLATDLGKNGLCDQRLGDWNDGLEPTDEAGERESVMVTQQLCFGVREMAELARRIGDTEIEKEAIEIYATFSKRLNEITWDGAWYTRTLCADGYRIGSDENEEAKVFMNTQSWAVLAGIADAERAKLCMDKVEEYCKTDVGYKVLSPPFTKYDPRTGLISNLVPNTQTNGGCYSHAAGYKGVADCVLGRAEEAWGTFERVAPDNPLNPVSKSAAEPFAFCNFFVPVNFMSGNSGYPWKTGTAGWFTMLMVEWILGARRHYDGLLIDPCLTKTIPHAKITRTFRGARYHITLDNTAGRCKGATSITVDGEKIEGNIIPPFADGDHKVNVVI